MTYRPSRNPQPIEKPWYVLECDGGYLGNVFELYNNSPKLPRLMVTNLQEAIPYPSVKSANEGVVLGRDILGVECIPVPIRFETRRTVVDGRKKDETVFVLVNQQARAMEAAR